MPLLPHVERAVVPREKIVDYLLNASHPHGQAKCRFLESFGFRASDWEALRDAVLEHATRHDITDVRLSVRGIRYGIDGALEAPDGRAPVVRVVWFVRAGEDVPRLVTLVPRRMAAP